MESSCAIQNVVSDIAMNAHDKTVTDVKRNIKLAIEQLDGKTDDDVRMVNNVYVGLCVLPSGNHIYICFGIAGSAMAYRGDSDKMNANDIASMIIDYTKQK